MNHYIEAQNDLDRSYGDPIGDGTALWRATSAQAHATLALADAVRDLAERIKPTPVDEPEPITVQRFVDRYFARNGDSDG